jgi:hypothetical protein
VAQVPAICEVWQNTATSRNILAMRSLKEPCGFPLALAVVRIRDCKMRSRPKRHHRAFFFGLLGIRVAMRVQSSMSRITVLASDRRPPVVLGKHISPSIPLAPFLEFPAERFRAYGSCDFSLVRHAPKWNAGGDQIGFLERQ